MPDDRGFDALLRHTLTHTESTSVCVDAETIAAWHERSLAPKEAAAVERHLSVCVHCQSVVAAMARAEPAVSVVLPLGDRWRLRWFVPLTAAAAATLIWVSVQPGSRPSTGPGQTELQQSATDSTAATPDPESATADPPGSRADVPEQLARNAAPNVPAPVAAEDQDETRAAEAAKAELAQPADMFASARSEASAPPSEDAAGNRMLDRVSPVQAQSGERSMTVSEAQGGAPAPPPAALAATAPLTNVPVDVVSPEAAARWRIHPDGRLERTTTAGASWDLIALPPGVIITAGSAPSASVCWLVGRSGVVLVSAPDGSFHRVAFPQAVDLVAITAASATALTVTTADGRVFTTADGGATWTLR